MNNIIQINLTVYTEWTNSLKNTIYTEIRNRESEYISNLIEISVQ